MNNIDLILIDINKNLERIADAMVESISLIKDLGGK